MVKPAQPTLDEVGGVACDASDTAHDAGAASSAAASSAAASSAAASSAAASSSSSSSSGAGDSGACSARHAVLLDVLDQVLSVRVDELSDGELRDELEVLETLRRRVETRTCRLASALTHREARRASRSAPDDPRAGERAARDTRRELSDRLNWEPGRAKRAVADGKWLGAVPRAGAAADRGELSARHARILADALNHFAPGPDRDRLEAELVEAAKDLDTTAFGRRCRGRLAEVDHEAAMRDQTKRQARQKASVSQDDQGMTTLRGQWAGLDAEIVATAIHAFRRPDAPGEHRDAERRTADAVVDAFKAALDHGDAPGEHGVRPHIIITVPVSTVRDGAGVASGRWTGPIAYGEIRRALDDAGLSWIAVDDESGLPMAASPESRHVPVGLWRALQLRDGGCIAAGCDAPAAWCDVMHLDERFADGGRLSLDTAGLGCRHHHRKLDLNGWTVTWHEGRPILHHPHHPPDATSGDHADHPVEHADQPGGRTAGDGPDGDGGDRGDRGRTAGSGRNGRPRDGPDP